MQYLLQTAEGGILLGPSTDISSTRFFGVNSTGQRWDSLPFPNSMKLTGTPKKPAIPYV